MLFFPNTIILFKWQNKEVYKFLCLENDQIFFAAGQFAEFSNSKFSEDKNSFNLIIREIKRLSDSAKMENPNDFKDSQNLEDLEISENLEDLEESENLDNFEDSNNIQGSNSKKDNTIELDD